MSVCPALDLTSVAYSTGSPLASPGLDDTGTCPAIPTGEDCSGPISDLLGDIGVILGPMYRLGRLCLMDLELEDIARYVGKALGVIAFVLAVAAAPILWVIQTSFGALRSVFSTVFSAASSAGNGMLRIAITPFLIPWHIAALAWEVVLNLYDELEPVLIYFSFALVIGACTGTIIALLTRSALQVLRAWFPFLRPRRQHMRANRRQEDRPRRGDFGSRFGYEHGSSSKDREGGKGKGEDKHADSAVYWSSSDEASDSHKGSFRSSALGGGGWHSIATPVMSTSSPSMGKSSRQRPPPVGVRVEDTIHEESSGENELV
ncbi:hypothetical protein MYCTH_2301246 [Thermothelomyces thermophilus ATCC 42464]|uniref:Uncharacterized protein n=1 Tax=Thermothelomyces thermophilus (strain ATCC 42464 / BCRC 31852 / DSM 1799) TaxID=573729 RepID=G2Q9C7_THET4|nr:uncharacterized protein MYCTH_2301246 [Thermothelomyces thermophilus ATCC 42464]AEO56386.1 hypothetical protein MYCTH_2301246 [Thermothelomyces thermophilus ATCC 42464]